MLQTYVRNMDRVSQACMILAVLLLIVAMLVVCQMIFLRYVFRAPTIWQTDFVVYAATASIFLGAPYVLMKRGHVGVDVVEMKASREVRRLLRGIGGVFGFLFCFAMLVASVIYVWEAFEGGWETPGVWKIPQWLPVLPMPIGFGLLCLQYLAEAVREGEHGGETVSGERAA